MEKNEIVGSAREEFALVPTGSKHLHGNLYRVPTDTVKYADGKLDFDNKKIQAINPRHMSLEKEIPGLDKESMRELRESIQSEGLHHPLICRPLKDSKGNVYLQLMNGERRLRVVNTFRKEKAVIFNPETFKNETADKVFEYVEVRIINANDREYYKHAFKPNETGVPVGDHSEVALVKYLRHCGLNDKDIIETTGKSITWLIETDRLVTLDKETFASFSSGQINRTAALKLASIDDVEMRLEKLSRAKQIVEEEFKEALDEADVELKKAEKQADLAAAEVAVTEAIGADVAEVVAVAEKAGRKAAKKKSQKERLATKARKVGSKAIDKALAETGDNVPKALTRAKIEKSYDIVKECLNNNGIDATTNEAYEGYDDNFMRAAEVVLQFVLKGNGDILQACRHFVKKQAKASVA